MKAKKLIEALNIIVKYEPEAEANVGHDTFFCGEYETRKKMSKEDRKRLFGENELGWLADKADDMFTFI